MTSIGYYAFNECTGLTSVTFGENVANVGEKAFYKCTGIKTLTLNENLQTIGNYAFSGCTGITGDLTIPDSATSIGEGAFSGCTGITGLKLSENLKTIPDYVFNNCNGITGELVIPDSVESLGDQTFYNCNKVERIVIGAGMKNLCTYGKNYSCLPFYCMSGVKEVAFKGKTVPYTYSQGTYGDIFYSMNALEKVYVPAESYSTYVSAYTAYINNAVITGDSLNMNIKNLHVTALYSKTVRLEWNKHTSKDVVSYVIERDGERIGITKNLTFTDENLENNKTYSYSVYGITADSEKTGVTTLSVTTSSPEITSIYTNHNNNRIGPTDGKVYISVKNTNGYNDLDGNEIHGNLYCLVNGERKFIGKSSLAVGSKGAKSLIYIVDWDVTDFEQGKYDVEFEMSDIDGATSVLAGSIYIDKSVPEKIINVVAVGNYTNIALSWSQSSEVDSTVYKIYRKSEVDSKFTLLKTINGRTTLTFTDTTVKENGTYSYYIVTVNSFGTESEPSDIAVAMRDVDTEAPTVTKLTPSSYSYICHKQSITVNAVDNLMVKSVKAYYSVDNGETWTLIGTDTTAPYVFSFNTYELSDGEVAVKALAYDANGNESEPMKVVYNIDNTGPEKVTGLKAKSILSSKLTLEWKDVSDADAACFILQQKNADGTYKTISSSITTLGYNLNELISGREYTFRVACVDIRGNVGEYSDDYTVSTDTDTMPPVITKLVPTASRYNAAITFRATANDDCGIKSIEIQVSTDRINWKTVSVGNYTTFSKSCTYTYNVPIDGYDDGSIFVRAVATDYSNNVSDTTESAPFVEYIIDTTAPNLPRDIIASGGDGWIYISWLQGDETDLSTYSVYRATSENGNYALIASGLKTISYYDTTAERDTVYYYKIRVKDSTGNLSDFSQVVSAKVADDVVPPSVVTVNPANGSSIGPSYNTVKTLVQDNNCIDRVVIEYKVNDAEEYSVLRQFDNINYYYKTVSATLPIETFSDGDKIYIRVYTTDIVGLTSEYSCEYVYHVDKVAPIITDIKTEIVDDNCLITWKDDGAADINGFKIYRINDDGTSSYLGSRSYSSRHQYSFYNYLYNLDDGDYTYKIEVYDNVGNYNSFITDSVHYERYVAPYENTSPVPVIDGYSIMEIGVEEYFDAGNSTDNRSVVSYNWDFGDGTTSTKIKPVKKYTEAGNFTVTLTVTDDEGLSSSTSMNVEVKERTSVGTVSVKVVDENGSAVPGAPVYFDLGGENQKIVYANNVGVASLLLEHGEHIIGAYKSGYLPVQKSIKVLPNATRNVSMTIIKQEIVTGKFEVTRMTFSEIEAAGIDVYDPANQNCYEVEVTVMYCGEKVPIRYIRNDTQIIQTSIGSSGGGKTDYKPGTGGSVESGGASGGSWNLTFVPNEKNAEIVAVVHIPVTATYLKEFFNVDLHIINNATSEFTLIDNNIHLNVPSGMTLMTGVNAGWYGTPDVHIDSIKGQETKTLSWVLRGDKQGEYDLTADYSSTLAIFNAPVNATFRTDEPIKVYGLSTLKFNVEVNDEIKYNALYFNIGLENASNIDIYNPQLDFDGIVDNITATTKQASEGIENGNGEADYSVQTTLLNVRIEYNDRTTQYVPFTWNSNGAVEINLDTLSPGDAIYYEYVAYNVVNYDDIAYFNDATVNVLQGYGSNVSVESVSMNLFSMMDSAKKLGDAEGIISEATKNTSSSDSSSFDAGKYTNYTTFKSALGPAYEKGDLPFLYDDSFFAKKATYGVIPELAFTSVNLASTAYKNADAIRNLLGSDGMGFGNISSYNYSMKATTDNNDFVAYTFATKDIVVNGEKSTVVAVVVRGTPSSLEWLSNFNIGQNGVYHEGFTVAANELLNSLDSYLTGKELDPSTTKFLVTGHSRGAAVANIVAEKLSKEQKYATVDNIYGYTFATPATSTEADTSLKNIINYCNNDDLIAYVPLSQWGFKKAGVTINFSMDSNAKSVFSYITGGTAYEGTSKVTDVTDALAGIAPNVGSYYANGCSEIMDALAGFLGEAKSEIELNSALEGIVTNAANYPIGFVTLAKSLIAHFTLNGGMKSIIHAHCQETYIAFAESSYPYENILATVKQAHGASTETLDISKGNALSYILNDSNYTYMSNSSLFDRIGEARFNSLKLLLTLDFDTLTKDEQKKVAEEILVKLLTDNHFDDDVDTAVDTQYIKTVKNVLSAMKSSFDVDESIPESERVALAKKASILISNSDSLNELAGSLKLTGETGIQNQLIKEFAVSTLSAGVIEKVKDKIVNECSFGDSASSLFKGISGVGKYGGMAVSFLIENPTDAYNSTEYAEYVHGLLSLHAYKDGADLILNSVISSYNNSDKLADTVMFFGGLALPVTQILALVDVDVQKIVVDTAKDLQKAMTKNFNYELEYVKNLAVETGKDAAKIALKSAIKKWLGKSNVWYCLLGTAFELVDSVVGIGTHYENADSLNIATYVSFAMLLGFEQRIAAFKSPSIVALLNNVAGSKYIAEDVESLAIDAMYLLKALCNSRLIGEQIFKLIIAEDNSTMLKNDVDYDTQMVSKANNKFGTSYKDVESLYDYICGNILKARDTIFNVEYTSEIEKPDAPTVTIDYNTCTTEQSFDESYEYCYADGEWKRCDGGTIPVKLKTNTQVLRVRKASANGTVAGEITTVTVFAKKRLSWSITARYDNGIYTFGNLSALYKYQICPIPDRYATPNWDNAFELVGGYNAKVSTTNYGEYLAVRALGDASKYETVSETSVVQVDVKQPLTVSIWGNGTVEQSSESSRYFVGDDIFLKANADDGAIFDGWYINNSKVSSDTEYILEMYKYAEIVAKFKDDSTVKTNSVSISMISDSSVYLIPSTQIRENNAAKAPAKKVPASSAANNYALFAGDKVKLVANFEPQNVSDKSIKWVSSNENIAVVDENGIVEFIDAGTVEFTATTDDGVSVYFSLTAYNNAIKSIKIVRLPNKIEYYENEEFSKDGLIVSAMYSDGKSEEIAEYSVSGLSNSVGVHQINVAANGRSTHFSVNVVHNYEWDTTTQPTCKSEGVSSNKCAVCGDVKEIKKIEPLEHECEWTITKEATEDSVGVKSYVCKNCGEAIKTEEYQWHAHNYVSEVVNATCETDGYTKHTCTICGNSYNTDEVKATGHSFSEKVKEPTCTGIGYTLHECSLCGSKYISDQKAALGHDYVPTKVEATCVTPGCTRYTCKNCEDSYDVDLTEKTQHSFIITAYEGTCEIGAHNTYTCGICGYTYDADEQEPLGHNYILTTVNATCEAGGYVLHKCSVCGNEYKSNETEAKGHNFGEWIVRTPSTVDDEGEEYRACVNCGKTETRAIPVSAHTHTLGDWTVETEPSCSSYGLKVRRCTECNEIVESQIIDALEHDYVEIYIVPTCGSNGYTEHKCLTCGYSYNSDYMPKLGHTKGGWTVTEEATCEKDGLKVCKCTTCGEILESETIAKKGHSDGDWEEIKSATCTENGKAEMHCKDCGALIAEKDVAATGHTYIKTVVASTCEKEGYTMYTCDKCDDSYTCEPTEKTEHKPVKTKEGKEATCTSAGYTEEISCAICGKVLTESVEMPMREHSYTAVVTAATCQTDGYTTHTCSACGESYTDSIVKPLGHTDSDNNGKCDRCGEKTGEPINPPKPVDPSENCSCACHKKGIVKFFFKIGLFFQKIFKKNRICRCGVWHY